MKGGYLNVRRLEEGRLREGELSRGKGGVEGRGEWLIMKGAPERKGGSHIVLVFSHVSPHT